MAEYDYIIVGGGSSGCVAAHRLVSEYAARVLVLEAGPSDAGMLTRMPAGTFKIMFGGSPLLKRYISAPQRALGGRTVPIAQANVIGGGSSINMMAYVRGSRADYERWNAASGGAGWGWDDLLPYFRRQEGNLRFDNTAHGGEGPYKVSDHYIYVKRRTCSCGRCRGWACRSLLILPAARSRASVTSKQRRSTASAAAPPGHSYIRS